LWLLLGGNLFVIALAVYERWPPQNVILFYWSQNIVIGVFACLRMLSWKNIVFVDDQVTSPFFRKAERSIKLIYFGAAFFGVHALFLKLLAAIADMTGVDVFTTFSAIRLALGVFFINQAVSFILNYRRDSATPTTYGQIFEKTFILTLPLILWVSCFVPIVILTVFVLMIAYFAGLNENTLAFFSNTLTSGLPAVALVLFMLLKALLDIPAHLASHSEIPA
jgi:hypothetical protein